MAIDIEAPGADEADLKAAIQALANDITVVTLSVNTTLDSTYYGKLVEVDTAAVVITFPTAPATQETLDVINTSAGSITVNGLTVAAGKTVSHISIDSAWVEISPNVTGGGSYTDEEARDANGIKPYVTGRWFLPANYDNLSISAGNASQGSTNMYIMPIRFRDGLTIDSLAVQISTLSAGGNFQLHIYASDAITHLPTGAPIYSSADQSTAATGVVTIGSLSLAVEPEWYWLGLMVDNTVAVFHVPGVAGTTQPTAILPIAGADTAANALTVSSNMKQFVKASVTYGTPPTLTGNQTTDALLSNLAALRVPALAFKGA